MLKLLKKASDDIDHKFQFYLCEIFGKLPSDPFFEQIDPLEKMFLFHGWAKKHQINIELLKDQAILTGSFSNPEMAKRMIKKPDYISSDEDMEKSWEQVRSSPIINNALEGIPNDGARPSRRKRKVVK